MDALFEAHWDEIDSNTRIRDSSNEDHREMEAVPLMSSGSQEAVDKGNVGVRTKSIDPSLQDEIDDGEKATAAIQSFTDEPAELCSENKNKVDGQSIDPEQDIEPKVQPVVTHNSSEKDCNVTEPLDKSTHKFNGTLANDEGKDGALKTNKLYTRNREALVPRTKPFIRKKEKRGETKRFSNSRGEVPMIAHQAVSITAEMCDWILAFGSFRSVKRSTLNK